MTACTGCALPLPDDAAFCARCGRSTAAAGSGESAPSALLEDPTAPVPAFTLAEPPVAPETSTRRAAGDLAVAPITEAAAVPIPATPTRSAGSAWQPPPARGASGATPQLPQQPPKRSATDVLVGIAGACLVLLIAAGVVLGLVAARRANDAANAALRAAAVPTITDAPPNPEAPDPAPQTPTDTPSDPAAERLPSDSFPTETTPTDPAPTDTTPTGTPAAVTPPPGGTVCSNSHDGAYAVAVAGNDHTSCPFANFLRDAYIQARVEGADDVLDIQSPVTHKNYNMACTGANPVTCTGGNDAVVLLWPGS